MQHVEAISGASRAARESTGTLAAHGAVEERRGMNKHPADEEAASTPSAAADKPRKALST
jgi:hypothetical protein